MFKLPMLCQLKYPGGDNFTQNKLMIMTFGIVNYGMIMIFGIVNYDMIMV